MWVITLPVVQGLLSGLSVVAVVQSGLSPFAQALIIALVSALVGALGVVVAAFVSARSNERVLTQQQALSAALESNQKVLAEHLSDVKKKIDASHRRSDP